MTLSKTLSDVESLTYVDVSVDIQGWKGEGLTKIKDGWITIHGALPSEIVRVKPHQRPHPSRRRIDAEILEILHQSPERQPTECEKFHFCHGCQLRMLSWENENTFKERKVAEILLKYADIDVPVGTLAIEALHRSTGLRNRAHVRVEKGVAGLTSLGVLVDMRDCAALTKRTRDVLVQVVAHLGDVPVQTIEALAPEEGAALVTIEAAEIPRGLENLVCDELGIRVRSQTKTIWQQGPTTTRSRAGNHLLKTSYDAWVPSSEEASMPLYIWIEKCQMKGTLAIDLGCGIGGVTRQILPGFQRIIGVDSDLHAIECFTDNFQNEPHVIPMPGAFEKALRQLCQKDLRPDLITINPMREPVGPLVHSLIRHLNPRQILYLGPSPAAAAKDLAAWQPMWRVENVFQANVHPHTHHTMLIALLARPHD